MKTSHYKLEQIHSLELPSSSATDYLRLLKPRVILLVVYTGMIGVLLAMMSGAEANPFIAFMAVFSIALGSGGAGAINMWYDRDIDSLMRRTQNRPIPAGRIPAAEAFSFGVCVCLLSVIILGLATNWLAAGILAFAIFFYVVIYTMWLKRRTPQNIVIGGAAGAFPPIIGWAAITGDVGLMPCLLFMITFLWTPPHFWALSLSHSADYEKAGVPMLPVLRGKKHTITNIRVYSIILAASTFAPYFLGLSGVMYLAGAILLNAQFLRLAFQITEQGEKSGMHLFGYSIVYLFAIFSLPVLELALKSVLEPTLEATLEVILSAIS
jgi:protoheme IX farnesyltransferase